MLGARPGRRDDNFFDLGGNSLIATQVVARINAALGAAGSVCATCFEAPTVAALAARVEPSRGTAERGRRWSPRPRPDRIPLSLAQQRMWFLNQFDPSSPAYNIRSRCG